MLVTLRHFVYCAISYVTRKKAFRGGSSISGKGVHMYKGVHVCVCGGVGVAYLILSHFSQIYYDNEIIGSH